MKERTSLAIDEHVRRAAKAAARARGISLSRYVTEVLEAHLAARPKTRFPRTVEVTGPWKSLAADHDLYAWREHRRE